MDTARISRRSCALTARGDAFFTSRRVQLSLQAVVVAVAFSGAIGLFFGYYPAKKASRLTPIEALRYD